MKEISRKDNFYRNKEIKIVETSINKEQPVEPQNEASLIQIAEGSLQGGTHLGLPLRTTLFIKGKWKDDEGN